jgi:hypothetical protein
MIRQNRDRNGSQRHGDDEVVQFVQEGVTGYDDDDDVYLNKLQRMVLQNLFST